jgi:hypothetical protein
MLSFADRMEAGIPILVRWLLTSALIVIWSKFRVAIVPSNTKTTAFTAIDSHLTDLTRRQ